MPKWLKYALLVLGPVVLVASIIYSLSGTKSTVPNSYVFGDVVTGEIVVKKKGSFASFPVKNSEGKRTLFPVEKQSDGSYVIIAEYRDALTPLLASGDVTKEQLKVDMQTFKIGIGSK